MRAIEADLLAGSELYREVMLEKVAHARESVWISTANVKDMQVERGTKFASVTVLFSELASRGVELRLLHFDRRQLLVRGGLALKICPRVHFKAVLVDGAWVYLGSANLTGAGLGAKSEGRRNFELGLCTEDFETVDKVKALFEAIWNGDECAACKLRSVCPDPIGKPAPRSLVRLGHSRRFGRR
jgi:phosphatidylserine/phosphatidylglycerophosphate/cardiolipin synthase-like enzyme